MDQATGTEKSATSQRITRLWRAARDERVGPYVLCVLALPVVAFACHIALSWGYYAAPHDEATDIAVAGLQIERAARFHELIGPYSRFGFNHPGPVSFYYYAFTQPLFWFVPSPLARHLLAQLLLNLAFLLVALHAVYVMARRRTHALLLAAAFFFVFARSGLGFDSLPCVWSPYLLIFPMLAVLATAAAIATGRFAFALPAAVAGVFIVHNHVSGIVIVAPLLAGAFFTGYFARRHTSWSRAERVSMFGAALFAILTSIPPLLEQFLYSDGNLSRIAAFFLENGGQHHPLRIAGHFIAGFFKAPFAFARINGEFWAFLILAACAITWRVTGRFERRLIIVFLSALLLSIFGASRVVDRIYQYMFVYEVSIVAVGLFLLLTAVGAHRPWLAWPLAALAALLFVSATSIDARPEDPRIEEAVRFVRPVEAKWYELFWRAGSVNHDVWGIAAGMALAMTRARANVCVPEEWKFMFGRAMSPCPVEGRPVRVAVYETAEHRRQVREHAAAFGATTIELGQMLPLELPIEFDTESSDDYFSGTTAVASGARWIGRAGADVHFVLGALPEGQSTGTVALSATAKGNCSTRVTLNGAALGTAGGGVTTLAVIPAQFRAHAVNTVRFSAPTCQTTADTPQRFGLKRVTLTTR